MTFLRLYFLLSGILTLYYTLLFDGNYFFATISVIFLCVSAVLFASKKWAGTPKKRRLHTLILRCSIGLGSLDTLGFLLLALAFSLYGGDVHTTVFERVGIGFFVAFPIFLSASIAAVFSYFLVPEKGTVPALEASFILSIRQAKNGKIAYYPHGTRRAGYLLDPDEMASIKTLYRNVLLLMAPMLFAGTRSLLAGFVLLVAICTYFFWRQSILLKGKPRIKNTDTRQEALKKFAGLLGRKRIVGFILLQSILVPLMGYCTWLFFHVPDRTILDICFSVFFGLLTLCLAYGTYIYIRLLRFFQ